MVGKAKKTRNELVSELTRKNKSPFEDDFGESNDDAFISIEAVIVDTGIT